MDNQDNRQSINEKVTISLAAKALKVSTKTIHRYIEKRILSRVKEGTRVYVPMNDIRALLSGQPKIDKSPRVHEKDKITVDRTHYDNLLVRLGQLEANQQLLLEYKEGLQIKDKELEKVKSVLNTNSAELDHARVTITNARNELQRLFEIKQDAEAKAKALLEQQAKIESKEQENIELRAEVERLRLPWWKKLWRK